MPKSDSIIVYLLFQLSINSISINHYKFDNISSPVPKYFTILLCMFYHIASKSLFLPP